MALAALLFVAIAPGAALAKKGYFVLDPSHSIQASVRGSHGFAISLQVANGHVYLSASNKDASVQYTARNVGNKHLIKAKFGKLGHVSLRFYPRGKSHVERWSDPSCKGGASLVQLGRLIGKLDFNGEEAYTAVHVSHIKGKEIRTEKEICKSSKSGSGVPASLKAAFLHASSEKEGLSFDAFRTEFKSRPALSGTSFNATVMDFHHEGMSIFRTIQASAALDAFDTTQSHGQVDTGVVTPPPPFTGSATYQRAPATDSETWTGTLAGEFPGLGTISLTGPQFCADSELFRSCRGRVAWIVSVG